jgi:GNAT superfamily N-acetyltransferase
MISVDQYLKNPCRSSSLPFYKLESFKKPDHMEVIHDDDYKGDLFSEPYFRLIHRLAFFHSLNIPQGMILEKLNLNNPKNLEKLSEMISKCYDYERLAVDQMQAMIDYKTFNPDLWLVLKDNEGKIVASGISEYDPNLKEGVLEWIQVLPAYKQKGLGSLIVHASLRELSVNADFVTVSGRINNGDNPMKLYKKCGFEGSDIWHIINHKD